MSGQGEFTVHGLRGRYRARVRMKEFVDEDGMGGMVRSEAFFTHGLDREVEGSR